MLRRRAGLSSAVAAVMVAALAGGCASDSQGDSDPASIGAVERSKTMSALGFAAVTDEGRVATVVGTLLNEGDVPDRLVSVRAEGALRPLAAVLPDGSITLPSEKPVQLAPRKGIMLVSPEMREGFFVELTLDFARSSDITLRIPVEPQSGPYAEVEVLQPADGDVAPGPIGDSPARAR